MNVSDIEIARIVVGERIRTINHDHVKALADSIELIGLQQPIVVGQDLRLVAGHHRLLAYKLLGRERIPCVRSSEPQDDLKSRLAEIDENLVRNDLTELERAEHLQERKRVYEQLFPETKHVTDRGGPGRGKKTTAESAVVFPSFVDDTASKTGESQRVIQKHIQIAKNLAPEERDAIRSTPLADRQEDLIKLGKIKQPEVRQAVIEAVSKGEAKTLNEAKAVVAKQQKHELAEKLNEKPLPPPTGKFDVIVVDPPWAYQSRKDDPTHRARNPYPDMTQEQLVNLPVHEHTEKSCVLWLWTTTSFIRDALELVSAWGFREKTILCWQKPEWGMGDYLRARFELCILAMKGEPTFLGGDRDNIIIANRREHSRKPEIFYELVETTCPGTKLELFARQQRPGWACWGAESDKFTSEVVDQPSTKDQ